jgi:hypothetical protein
MTPLLTEVAVKEFTIPTLWIAALLLCAAAHSCYQLRAVGRRFYLWYFVRCGAISLSRSFAIRTSVRLFVMTLAPAMLSRAILRRCCRLCLLCDRFSAVKEGSPNQMLPTWLA